MKKFLLLNMVLIFLANCGSDDPDDGGTQITDVTAPKISGIIARDVADSGDASDMEISFNKVADETLLTEYRVFVVKSSQSSSFNLLSAEAASASNYHKLDADGTDKLFTLSANANDSDGDLIAESVSYVVFALSVADGTNATINALSSASSAVILEQPVVQAATNVRIIDVANSGNGSDIEASFAISSTQDISELRLFVVKGDKSSSFDLTAAESVPSDNYTSISLTSTEIRLSANSLDSDGDAISEGTGYVAFVLSVANPTLGISSQLSGTSLFLTLQQVNAVSTLAIDIPGGSGGMDVDADGNIYMADFGPSLNGGGTRVFKITPEGEVSVFATGLNGASGNDFDANGNLIQSNITGGTLSSIAPDGTVSALASGFSSPVGVTVDANGDFYVCNCGSNSISKVTADGSSVTNFVTSTLMNCPNGIDIDADGNLYVASFSTADIVKITPAGEVSVLATTPGTNNGHLLINGSFIYVVSRGLHQIHRVTLDGSEVSLFAGTGIQDIKNGPVAQASFSYPNDLAFSADGKKLYINDVSGGGASNVLSPVVIRVIDIVE